ncbi:TolC family protein [Myxococcaceae bacterium GXIMD 01537]
MISVLALTAVMATAGASPVLTLEEALDAARQNNLDLKVARARLEQAETASRKAWAGYLPTITVSGSYTRNSNEANVSLPTGFTVRDTGSPTSEPGTGPGVPTNLTVVPTDFAQATIQPLDSLNGQLELRQALIAPQLWAGIRAAYSAERLAGLNTEAVKREILFGVAQAYYGGAAAQANVTAQERLFEVNQARLKDTQARFDAGTVTRVAVLRAQLDLSLAEQNLVRARNSLAASKLVISTLIVREDTNFELAPPPEPQMPIEGTDLVNQALTHRPDVAAGHESINLTRLNRSGVWLSYLPVVGLVAAARTSNAGGFAGANTTWAITAAASWTLWDGGLREANLREQSARVAEATSASRLLELRAREDVKRSQLDLETALANRTRAEQALELARETERLTQISFKADVATYLEVADANASLTSAEVSAISERLNAALAALRLLRAVGAFGVEPVIAKVPPESKKQEKAEEPRKTEAQLEAPAPATQPQQ